MDHRLATIFVFLLGSALPAAGYLGEGSWSNHGPEGVSAPKLFTDASNSSVLYLTGVAGLYKSIDGGESWNRLLVGGRNFAISQSNPSVLLYGGIDGPVRSEDQGRTWVGISYPPTSDNVGRGPFLVDPRDDKIVYLLQEAIFGRFCYCSVVQVYKSIDGGHIWSLEFQLPGEFGAYPKLAGAVIDARSVIWIFGSALHRKLPDGNRSTVLSAPVESLAVDPRDASRVYAGGSDGLYRSTDGGDTWSLSTLPKGVSSIVLDAASPSEVLAKAGVAWFRSEDYGTSWTLYSNDGTDPLEFDPINPLVIYGNNGSELRKSTDHGLTWNPIVRGLVATMVSVLAPDSKKSGHIYATVTCGNGVASGTAGTDVFQTQDAGRTWSRLGHISTPVIQSLAFDSVLGELYAGSSSGVFASADNGESWRLVLPQGSGFAPLAIAPSGAGTVYFGGQVLFRSYDGGRSWNSVESIHLVSALAVDPTNADALYASGDDGKGFDGLLKSLDRGGTWSRMDVPFSGRALAIDPVDPRNVYVGNWDGVYGTSDAGMSWNKVSSGLLGSSIVSLAVHPTISGRLFALDHEGRIFWTQDHAQSWRILLRTPRITPPIALSPAMLTIDAGSQALFVGTSGEGVYTLSPVKPRTVPAIRVVPTRP